jgi:hypothetical protein
MEHRGSSIVITDYARNEKDGSRAGPSASMGGPLCTKLWPASDLHEF